MDLAEKPVPKASEVSQPFWDAARQGRLVIQACASCGKLRHYPRPLCDRCFSTDVAWREATGRGKVHSWTVAHHAFHPAFKSELPYVLLTVDLDEGVRALGRWRGDPELRIGLPVVGRFEPRSEGLDLVFQADS